MQLKTSQTGITTVKGKRAEQAGRAGQEAQQDENDEGRERPEGAMLRHARKCRTAKRIQDGGFCAREEVRHAQAECNAGLAVRADAPARTAQATAPVARFAEVRFLWSLTFRFAGDLREQQRWTMSLSILDVGFGVAVMSGG